MPKLGLNEQNSSVLTCWECFEHILEAVDPAFRGKMKINMRNRTMDAVQQVIRRVDLAKGFDLISFGL